MSVSGNRLTLNGVPFLARGFNMVALLTPPWCVRKETQPAAAMFSQSEMDVAKAWRANTLRFQVSQDGLTDPTVSQADRDAYLAQVESGVALARENGFTVILSMQDQYLGCGQVHPLPSSQTVDAWNVLAPVYADDPYVMFELFNEPTNTNDSAGWAQWKDGGTSPDANLGDPAVGEQTLIDQIRALGNTNVVIADAARNAERTSGMPLLSDPTGNLAYAIHPYFYTNGPSWWDAEYGAYTPTVPVIATEWNYRASGCGTAYEQLAPALLAYLGAHGIGVLGHALDVPKTLVADSNWTPTKCGTAVGGSGQVLKDFFASEDPDITAPSAPDSLQGSASGATHIDLTWNASSDDRGAVAGYVVLRDGVVVAHPAGTSYTDTAVSPNSDYSYSVEAVDPAGNVSDPSTAVEVDTGPDVTPPSAPTGLSATYTLPSTVALSWQPSTDDVAVAGYTISRDGTVLTTTNATTSSDTTVTSGSTYVYTVSAFDAAGNAGPATTVNVTTKDATPPTTPSGLTARITTPSSVTLSWQPSSDDIGVTGYRVTRDGAAIATTTATTLADATMPAGKSHSYTVSAVDAAGNSSPPASIAVTAPPSAAPGLTAKYFDNENFTAQKLVRVDPGVNVDWGTRSPVPGVSADTFSVRWTGSILPVANGTYTFYLRADEGARLWVNGVQLVNAWTQAKGIEKTATAKLSSTRAYPIKVEYHDHTGAANVVLSWSSGTLSKQVVPSAQLLAK